MKKIVIVSICLIFILSGCTGDKYADIALSLEDQDIKVNITDIAHENAEEIMKLKENDNLLVMVRGSC